MKPVLKILSIGVLICLTSLTIERKTGSKHYIFNTKYDRSSVTLYDNGTFTQYKRSCNYVFTCKGNWLQNSDTITLNQKRFKKSRGAFKVEANRSNQLIILNDSCVNYLWNIQNGFGDDFAMCLEQSNAANIK